jgi:hypothetical protein
VGKTPQQPKNPTRGKSKQEVEMDDWAEDMWTVITDQDRKIEEAKK